MNVRRGLLTIGVTVVATAVTTGLAAAPGSAVKTTQPSARAWVTTPDGQYRMSNLGQVPFHIGGSKSLTITVDPSRSYQTMDGFGASITDSSAHVLYSLQGKVRDAAMSDLFSPTQGDGLSVLRQPMGASDFVAGGFYTYNDLAPGQTDYGMRHFSIAHDQPQILPLLRQALRLNPAIKVIATPWSPPAWMKTNQSLIGGRLIDDPRVYGAYARYFVDYVQAYQHAGVPIYAVTVQNEPQNRNPSGYPGMDLPVAQEAKLINALGPALQAAGLDTKILGYDHNWSEHPGDIASTPPGETPETEYARRPAHQQRRALAGRDRLPLLLRGPDPADRSARGIPRQGGVVHRMFWIARADRPARAGLLRHAEVARPQSCSRSDPQLGQDRRELESGVGPLRRPTQRRL